jgi:hypothetical protein
MIQDIMLLLPVEDVICLRLTCKRYLNLYGNVKHQRQLATVERTLFGRKGGLQGHFDLEGPKYRRGLRKNRWELVRRLDRETPNYDLCYYCRKLHPTTGDEDVCCVRKSLVAYSHQLVHDIPPDEMTQYFIRHMNFTRLYSVMKAHREAFAMPKGPGKRAALAKVASKLLSFADSVGPFEYPCAAQACDPKAQVHCPSATLIRHHVPFRVFPSTEYEMKQETKYEAKQIVKKTSVLVCINEFRATTRFDLLGIVRGILLRCFRHMCVHNNQNKHTFMQNEWTRAILSAAEYANQRGRKKDARYDGPDNFIAFQTRCPKCPTTLTAECMPGMNLRGVYFTIHIVQNLGTCETPLCPGYFNCFGDKRDLGRLAPPGEEQMWRAKGTPGHYTARKPSVYWFPRRWTEQEKSKLWTDSFLKWAEREEMKWISEAERGVKRGVDWEEKWKPGSGSNKRRKAR